MSMKTSAALAEKAIEENVGILVEQAKACLQKGQLAEAERMCAEGLQASPRHPDALYLLAATQRYARLPLDALVTTALLIEIDPGFGRAHQERGHCLRALGRTNEALASYQAAVTYNMGLLASWRILAELHEAAGRDELAGFARAQCAYLESLPSELQSVISLIHEHRIAKAENLCRAFLQKNGHHIEGMRLLAEIGVKFNSYDDAEFLLESCVVLEPENTNAHFDYVNVLHKRQKFGEALEQAKVLRSKDRKSVV